MNLIPLPNSSYFLVPAPSRDKFCTQNVIETIFKIGSGTLKKWSIFSVLFRYCYNNNNNCYYYFISIMLNRVTFAIIILLPL